MSAVLVDSNVLLDIIAEGSEWCDWSATTLAEVAEHSALFINPIIYAEVSVRFARIEELDQKLPADVFRREPLPWAAGFLAGKCFLDYRSRGGAKRSPLPDFYVGAHAAVRGAKLLTRDTSRYRGYFPGVELIAPNA